MLTADPPPLSARVPECPEAIVKAVHGALAAEPARRYPTFEDLLNELR